MSEQASECVYTCVRVCVHACVHAWVCTHAIMNACVYSLVSKFQQLPHLEDDFPFVPFLRCLDLGGFRFGADDLSLVVDGQRLPHTQLYPALA